MQPRREPLLWLQCLAIGAIPLELLLIRVLLAGADPGPVPLLERLLIWAIAVLAPAAALLKRPADWGSLLLVRLPASTRTDEQHQLSAQQGGLLVKVSLSILVIGLLPLIWWLDESAGLVQEISPLQDSSRLVALLLSAPLLAVIVWQLQQLVQAVLLLSGRSIEGSPETGWDAQRLQNERSSFGLQLLELQPLIWPEPEPISTPPPVPAEPPGTPEPASSDSTLTVAVEPEQGGEEEESSELDPEISQGNLIPSGSPEEHGEQTETSRGEESEPDQSPQPPPGSL